MAYDILETLRQGGLNQTSPMDDSVFKPKPLSLGRVTPELPTNTQFLKTMAPRPSFPQQQIAKRVTDNSAKKKPTVYKNISANISNLLNLGAKTTEYGTSTKYEKFHPGIDVANVKGTSIPSTIDGTVTEVITGKKQGDKGFGNQVVITDSQGNKHKFSHLDKIFTKVGQQIRGGQQIATMGNSGSTYSPSGKGTGTHLDYRIESAIVNAANKYLNPYTYFNA